MKNNSINSNAYGYLLSLLAAGVKVYDAWVEGKYLCADLSSGITFKVKNQTYDKTI